MTITREKKAAAARPLTHAEILDGFYSQECAACKRKKTAGVSFCRNCIHKLPVEIWRGLQVDNSKGNEVFDRNFRHALEFLRELKGKKTSASPGGQ